MAGGRATVVIAASNPDERGWLRGILEASALYAVVLEVGDAVTAVERVTELRPDVLVIALRLDELSGLEALPAIRSGSPETAVVMLADAAFQAGVRLAGRLGARGWICPSQPREQVLQTMANAIGRELRGVPVPLPARRARSGSARSRASRGSAPERPQQP